MKGRSTGPRHTDRQTDVYTHTHTHTHTHTDRQTWLKIRALQVLQSGQQTDSLQGSPAPQPKHVGDIFTLYKLTNAANFVGLLHTILAIMNVKVACTEFGRKMSQNSKNANVV